MIDKLDVRVGWESPFTREVEVLVRETKGTKMYPFRPSQHYAEVGDLRPFGIPAFVHLGCKHGKAPIAGNHKIEIMDAGKEGYRSHLATMEKIFNVDPRRHELMRVDLAADVPEVGVGFFQQRARIKFKQWAAEIGMDSVQYSQMGRREIQTVYMGKRPNCFRFYDKTAERLVEYRRLMRKVDAEEMTAAGNPPATFAEMYGHDLDAVITRAERQCGGGRVPLFGASGDCATVGDLRRAAEFNPFDRLEILPSGKAEPRRCDYTTADYAAGMWLREKWSEWGAQQLRAWVYQAEARNTARFFERFKDFLPESGDGVTEEKLYEIYRESVAKQLAA